MNDWMPCTFLCGSRNWAVLHSGCVEQMGLACSVVIASDCRAGIHLGVVDGSNTRQFVVSLCRQRLSRKMSTVFDPIEAVVSVMEERLTLRGNIRIGVPLQLWLLKSSPDTVGIFRTLSPDINLKSF